MSFREKYLKYKTKYLQLKNMIGSGEKTAKQYYLGQLNNKYTDIRNIFVSDNFLRSNVADLETQLPLEKPSNIEEFPVFNQIFDVIKEGVDKDYIDLLCKIYLTGNLGIPNSLENKGRLIDSIVKFKLIPTENRDGKIQAQFNSLEEIETFVESKSNIIQAVELKRKARQDARSHHKKIKEEGEDDVIIELETPNVIVYQPTTEAGAKFYGRNTRWCTAATNNNMFNYYNEFGPLHIIVLKNKFDSNRNRIKYQVQLETAQFMNVNDENVTVSEIINEADDEEFKKSFIEYLTGYLNDLPIDSSQFTQSFNRLQDILPEMKDLIKIYISDRDDSDNPYDSEDYDDYEYYDYQNILYSLGNYNNLEVIIFGNHFNYPLEDLLSNLTNLQNLIFGHGFNQPLGDSLSNLTSLQNLTFGNYFDKPLGDSLSNLTSLQNLTFGNYFDKPLGDSLSNLTSLQNLTFGHGFTQPLGDSLSNLTNLKNLDFGRCFTQPLGDSLLNLTNLQNLIFGAWFNQPLGNSLSNLTSLQNLTFGSEFNQPLGNSLSNLTSLQNLTFGYNFNQPLEDSLSNLTNLKNLTFGYNFNQPLGDSLSHLINLQNLTFGNNFNQVLGDSLSTLTNLEEIEFGFNFYQPLRDSLSNLTKLKKIIISRGYPYKSTLPNIEIEYR